MKTHIQPQRGMTLVELMVALAISMVIILAAVFVYMASVDSQRAQDRSTVSTETGAFAMQMMGRAIMNAGFYPAPALPIPVDVSQTGMYDTYPPIPAASRVSTDWADPASGWPPTAFQTGIYGCDGSKLDVATSLCGTETANDPDTLVINYFTSDSMGGATGSRFDCTGRDVASDPSNSERNKDAEGVTIADGKPPRLPLFGSNRYALSAGTVYVGQTEVNTKSLVCSGNGKSPHGTADSTAYQPLLAGIEDLQFTYGVYSSEQTLSPDRFYTAAQVNGLSNASINGVTMTGWQRVVSIRVCILTKTLNGKTRIADKSGSERKYVDCQEVEKNQPTGETYTRLVQVFGARNGLKQSY
jgi:type IV pilus assembly protein PilW